MSNQADGLLLKLRQQAGAEDKTAYRETYRQLRRVLNEQSQFGTDATFYETQLKRLPPCPTVWHRYWIRGGKLHHEVVEESEEAR